MELLTGAGSVSHFASSWRVTLKFVSIGERYHAAHEARHAVPLILTYYNLLTNLLTHLYLLTNLYLLTYLYLLTNLCLPPEQGRRRASPRCALLTHLLTYSLIGAGAKASVAALCSSHSLTYLLTHSLEQGRRRASPRCPPRSSPRSRASTTRRHRKYLVSIAVVSMVRASRRAAAALLLYSPTTM
jgi:hypothetical protein